MKVFFAGATGVVGKQAVAALVHAGHDVTGVARSPQGDQLLRGLGAVPRSVDLFDPKAVAAAVEGHEVVCNLATHIPPLSKAMAPGAWSENDRLRSEASRNLTDAAREAGASRYVQESIGFVYEDRGEEWIDEDTPLDIPAYTASVLDAESQAKHFTESGGLGIVLRFGMFYSADSTHTLDFVRMARYRLAASIGNPDGYMSSIHSSDAGSAVAAALRVDPGVYNVVDDHPLTRREYFAALAEALGAKRPRMLFAPLGRLGGARTRLMGRSQRVSNHRFEEATGWTPRYPNARNGLRAVVAELAEREAREVNHA